MNHSKQLGKKSTKSAHGGDLTRGRRKGPRPLCIRRSLHVVLRSDKAKGYRSLNNNRKQVELIIKKSASRFQIRVYSFTLNHNHIHLSLLGKTRQNLQNFFRVLAGHIAQEILRKYPLPIIAGNAPKKVKYRRKFWNELMFSRIITWGREYKSVIKYIELNHFEALGIICRWKPPSG